MSLIARNTLFLTVAKFFSVAIYAVFGLALPRFFGDARADEVGLYTLLSSLLFFGSMLTSFGIPLIVTREIARASEKAPQLLARGRAGMLLGYALSVVLLGGWLLIEAWKRGTLTPELFWAEEGRTLVLFAMVMGIVFFDAMGSLGDAVFQGFERMALPAAIEILTGLLRAGGAFLVLVLAPVETKLIAIYLCFLVGAGVRGVLLPRLVRTRLLKGARGGKVTLAEAWQTIVSSGFIALFRMLRMLRNRLDVLLMGVLYVSLVPGVADADVDVARAIYGQALRVAIVFHTVTMAFNTALFPRLARLTGDDGSRDGARALYSRAVRWQAFWAIPLAVGIFFYADVIASWFGEIYAAGSPEAGVPHSTGLVLRILLVAVLFDCLGGPVGSLILGEKSMERKIPMLGGVVAGTNLVLNLFLIPRYGILGAAIASATTAAVELMVKLGLVGRLYGSPLPVMLRTWPYYALAGLMAAGLIVTRAEEHWFLGAVLGAGFYLSACILTRQVDPAVIQILRRKLGRTG